MCLAFTRSGRAGVVTNCAQADLVTALNEGGLVTFACDGTITLTNEITVSRDALLDGSGHNITISGNNATRFFNVNAGIKFTLINLTIANGHHKGSDEFAGTNNVNSKLGFGGAIYNNGGGLTLASCVVTSNNAVGGKAAPSQTNGLVAGELAGEAKGGAIFSTMADNCC